MNCTSLLATRPLLDTSTPPSIVFADVQREGRRDSRFFFFGGDWEVGDRWKGLGALPESVYSPPLQRVAVSATWFCHCVMHSSLHLHVFFLSILLFVWSLSVFLPLAVSLHLFSVSSLPPPPLSPSPVPLVLFHWSSFPSFYFLFRLLHTFLVLFTLSFFLSFFTCTFIH